jgi:hypothetical protein
MLRACHETVPVAERDHLGVLGYSPLAAGFLTGKYSPDREAIPRGTRFDIIPGHIDMSTLHPPIFSALNGSMRWPGARECRRCSSPSPGPCRIRA